MSGRGNLDELATAWQAHWPDALRVPKHAARIVDAPTKARTGRGKLDALATAWQAHWPDALRVPEHAARFVIAPTKAATQTDTEPTA
jgi:hypothetical protein